MQLDDLELERYIKHLEREMLEPDLDLHVLIRQHEKACLTLKSRGISYEINAPF